MRNDELEKSTSLTSSHIYFFQFVQFDPDDADLDLGLPVSNKEEFRFATTSFLLLCYSFQFLYNLFDSGS